MEKYIIYKTTNIKTGKYYIGAHTTNKLDDGYLGSGAVLKKAIKKYGKKCFIRETIAECQTKDEMYLMEKKLLDKFLGDPLCYNIKPGGVGGWDYVNKNKLLFGEKNPMKNPEVVKKCVESCKKTKNKNIKKYIDIANNNLKKAIEKNLGSKRPEQSIFMTEHMKNAWKKNKEKIRDSLSETYILTDPEGKEYITNRLSEFALENNLSYTTLWKSSKTNKTIKKGKCKGWTCKIIQN